MTMLAIEKVMQQHKNVKQNLFRPCKATSGIRGGKIEILRKEPTVDQGRW
jgi:hypothetical protein